MQYEKTVEEIRHLVNIYIDQGVSDPYEALSNLLYNDYMCNWDDYPVYRSYVLSEMSNRITMIMQQFAHNESSYNDLYPLFNYDDTALYDRVMTLTPLGHMINNMCEILLNSKIMGMTLYNDFLEGVYNHANGNIRIG